MGLIDADALKSAIDSLDWYSVNADGVLISGAKGENEAYVRFDEVEKAIKDAPTVDTIQHAHWLQREYGTFCSRCRCLSYVEFDYCPQCGAKMEDEQDDKH